MSLVLAIFTPIIATFTIGPASIFFSRNAAEYTIRILFPVNSLANESEVDENLADFFSDTRTIDVIVYIIKCRGIAAGRTDIVSFFR